MNSRTFRQPLAFEVEGNYTYRRSSQKYCGLRSYLVVITMLSSHDPEHSEIGSDKKNTLSLKFKLPRMDSLLALSSKITPFKKNNFICKYGQILDLLTTSVDVSAFVALYQCYDDPPLRCFTFKEFQLVPIIEEYERLLGWYVKYHPPFTKLGELLMPESVVEALHLSVEEVTLGVGPSGFSRKFLESWNSLPVVTQVPLEGVPINLNAAKVFHVPAHGGSQADVDDHHSAFFVPIVESMYEPYGPSPTDIDRRLHMMDESSTTYLYGQRLEENPTKPQRPLIIEKPIEISKPVETRKFIEAQKPVEIQKPTEIQEPTMNITGTDGMT
ncbi:hypothetical protein KIW84_011874 [Lathyrus oleraceus]|uniref:DUF7745 domain-containing protein n=1 Tax=Pisum sativum TaxID=3888 RepID=A0A9D5GVC9_PEA|nr:hypothetical protein KIW84_011874 [Pisum sativum]